MLRAGRGLGQAIYCDDLDGWQRAINVAEDVTRASALFATLAAPVAGKGAGGAPCVRCFEAGTDVETSEGLKSIEQIEAGDLVLSYNETTGLLEYREVSEKFTRAADDIYELRVEGEERTIGVTSDHPFFVRSDWWRDNLATNHDDGQWRETKDLKPGDQIRRANGVWATVVGIVFRGRGEVFNFTVEGNHNYFVGSLGLLTHNTCINTGLGRAPRKSTPNTIYEQLDPSGNLRSRTFYDQNGQRFSRQDFDHAHGGLIPHEHQMRFDEFGRPIAKKTYGPLPSGY